MVADLLTITQTYVLQCILAWMQMHKQCWKPGKGEKKKRIPNRNGYFTKLSRGNTDTVVQPQVALWPEC